ncbi:STN domain-containing protein [Cereibacter sphaeroides]|uniref:STN domain-containing protein n=1 Tax=Cereibacter sphaeroides TaxID=1063 RepID=UPI0015FAA3BF|nr:STN domain-containing protein [Cereibacter sphaeroides]
MKGRLAALASLACLATGAARAQEAQRIDIAAQPLASAVLELGRKTGLQVVVDSRLTAGRQSVAVSGVMTARQALGIMLGESGLQPNVVNDDTLTMRSRAGPVDESGAIVLDAITVAGEVGAVPEIVASSSAAGTKTGADLRDVPQAVSPARKR